MRQTLRVENWHPATTPNARARHWRQVQQRHHLDRDMAWARARQANWEFMPGRVKLTIAFVYPRTVRVDADNLVARCKGLIDGLKCPRFGRDCVNLHHLGFFTDDCVEFLDLHVNARIEKGVKATEISLESTDG